MDWTFLLDLQYCLYRLRALLIRSSKSYYYPVVCGSAAQLLHWVRPQHNNSSSDAIPGEAMDTSLGLRTCSHIVRLELFKTNRIVATERATAPAGSSKAPRFGSFSRRSWPAIQSYSAAPTGWQHLGGEGRQDPRDVWEGQWDLHRWGHPAVCLLPAGSKGDWLRLGFTRAE